MLNLTARFLRTLEQLESFPKCHGAAKPFVNPLKAKELPSFGDIRQASREIASDFRVAVGGPKDYAEGLRGSRRWADDPQLWGYSQ